MLVTTNMFNVCFAVECSVIEASVKLSVIPKTFRKVSKFLFGKEEGACNTEVTSSSYDLIVFFSFPSVI